MFVCVFDSKIKCGGRLGCLSMSGSQRNIVCFGFVFIILLDVYIFVAVVDVVVVVVVLLFTFVYVCVCFCLFSSPVIKIFREYTCAVNVDDVIVVFFHFCY